MFPQLFTRENIHTLTFPQTEDGDYARRYLLPMMTDGVQKYIRNARNTQLMIAKVDDVVIPITLSDFHPDNTYTVSPYSHYILYGGLEEVKHLGNPLAEAVIKTLMKPVSWFFRAADFDRVAYVNNYLLSTNLYPSVNSDQLSALSEALIRWFPDRAVVFRSVDQRKNPHVYQTLEGLGYDLVLSRQVWFMQPEECVQSRGFKGDRRALRHVQYEIVEGADFSDEDLMRSVDLYNMLYLEKYSYYNPQFTFEFMKLARDAGTLHLRALKQDGNINGVIGYFIRNGAMTLPLLGYDTSLSKEKGLYRLLTQLKIQEGLRRDLLIHSSSGVGKFKKARGAKSAIEYNAVYSRHLPTWRQGPWKLLKVITKSAAPYFRKMDF